MRDELGILVVVAVFVSVMLLLTCLDADSVAVGAPVGVWLVVAV